MNLTKSLFVLLSILLMILSSCKSKDQIDYKYLTSNSWIYNSDSLPDSIRNFTDNYLVFEKEQVNFNGEIIGEYHLSSDTIKIIQTTYVSLSGNKEEKREVNVFTGLITKLDSNEIRIKRISGGFPLKYQESYGNFDKSSVIRFVNQESRKRNHVKLGYISVASSSCYGRCPEFNFELYNNRKFKFRCTDNCERIGSYTGKISKPEMRRITEIVSYLNLHDDSTVFATPIDAPQTALKIRVNKKDFYFNGYRREFQLKMQELLNELFKLTESSKMTKTTSKISFKLRSYELPVEKTIVFLPLPKE